MTAAIAPSAAAAGTPLAHGLELHGLSHRFGPRLAVDDIALAIEPGEVHCLVGPSGCGKTTTLRLIAGLEQLQAGRIALNTRVLAEPGRCLPPELRRVGLMFQDFALFPHLRVRENVAFGLGDWARRGRKDRVDELLRAVNMSAYALAYPHTLSGGEQQRVALARALAPAPELMLLDEAFSALDTSLRARVRDEALTLLRANGTPTLLVTHDPEEAIQVGDRIHVMLEGRLVQRGTPAQLYAAPANPFVAGFFGPVNRFRALVAGGEIRTPLGTARIAGFADGMAVDAIVRPEAVRIRPPGGNGTPAQVLLKRELGPVSLLRLGLADGSSVKVRQSGSSPAEVGDRVEIDIDPAHLFVYPATN